MTESFPNGHAGLCETCRWARTLENRRGSVFLLCGKSSEDPRFPRYPRLPVLQCSGFQREEKEG